MHLYIYMKRSNICLFDLGSQLNHGNVLAWLENSKFNGFNFQGSLASTGCPKKHGNLVTNSISSLLWISIVIPNFKSHNIIMSARVYFMKRVKGYKDVSIMAPQDEQVYSVFLCCSFLVLLSTIVFSQNINK